MSDLKMKHDGGKLQGIVYLSQAATEFDDEALDALAAHAAGRNDELDVTGYLYFEKGRFIQYIEGAPQTASELMQRIQDDSRHKVLLVSRQENVPQRRFPGWSMRRLDLNDLIQIRLETLLADYMFVSGTLLPGQNGQSEWEATIWRMVDRIADLRTYIASGG